MFIGIPNGSLFCGIGSKAKGEKAGKKLPKKPKNT